MFNDNILFDITLHLVEVYGQTYAYLQFLFLNSQGMYSVSSFLFRKYNRTPVSAVWSVFPHILTFYGFHKRSLYSKII